MLDKKMNLRDMIAFVPNENDMLSLPMDVVVWIKVAMISKKLEDNHDFIRYLLSDEEAKEYFKDYEKTIFIDFDASSKKDRYITFLELYCRYSYSSVSIYLEELLSKYDAKADVVIDLFTHDDHFYRLSELDGEVKLEEIPKTEKD